MLLIICIAGFGLAALQLLFQKASQSKSSAEIPASTASKNALPEDKVISRYEHVFVITAENKSYEQIIGSSNAPNLNRFAKFFGLATQFYREVHPSEANYVAMPGGSTFGIHDDDAYYCTNHGQCGITDSTSIVKLTPT